MNNPVERNEVIKVMKLKCFESTDSNGIEQYLFPLEDGSFIAIPKERIEHRQNGRWVSNHDGSWNCSECGLRVFIYAKGNFCPNCGAKMKEADDDIV